MELGDNLFEEFNKKHELQSNIELTITISLNRDEQKIMMVNLRENKVNNLNEFIKEHLLKER
jgi:hypothetical protein